MGGGDLCVLRRVSARDVGIHMDVYREVWSWGVVVG
jgi:hypothetical protein